MEKLYNCSEYSSVHGINHFVRAGARKYLFRVLWAGVFAVFLSLFIYFQIDLFHEIVVEKPTVVEKHHIRSDTLNFPNVVICDMNQEHDKFENFTNANFGNVSGLDLFPLCRSLVKIVIENQKFNW